MQKHPLRRFGPRRFNLRTRFLLAFTALIALLTVLIAGFAAYRFATDMERQIEQNGHILADILAKEAFLQTVVLGHTNLAFVAESFAGGDVLYVQIVHNGAELTQKTAVPIELPLRSIYPGQYGYRKTLPDGTAYVDIVHSFAGRTASSRRGIQRDLVDSYVRLGFSLGPVRDDIRQGILRVALVALGTILAGSVVFLFYYRRAWKPIERINEAMAHFGRGQTRARAHVHSGDELETLSRSFNRMADALVKKDEQMRQVNLEMQRANRAKSDFLAAMSHDLKTPLHVISGYAQLLSAGDGGDPSATQRAHLKKIVRAGDRLLEFIERILNFSKVELGQETLQLECIDVQKLAEQVLESLEPLAQQKALDLKLELETPIALRADGPKLEQVLSNLVGNAIKYTPTGSVTVRVYEKDAGVFFVVEDTGPGIPRRYTSRIFEAFGRLPAPPGNGGNTIEGIGLGLAIVKRYVALHHGRVSVKSAPGQGSRFCVFIPLEVKP